jgi:quercetin dioxygenase-like cupin family protein
MRPILFVFSLLLYTGYALAQSAASQVEPSAIMVTPDQVTWSPASPRIPRGAKMSVLEGDPRKTGPFTMRVSFPDGYRIGPHFHPSAERVTVLQGTYRWGVGDKFDTAALKTLPAGSFAVMPPGTHHFVEAKGPTVTQVSGIGPWKVMYVSPADDPQSKTRP